MRLQDKVAFISGSTRGIGRTTAEMFAAEGAKVVVSGRSVDKGEKVAARIREQGGDATFIRLDVSDESSVRDAIAATVERYGTLTTLINNAAPTDLVSVGMKPMHALQTATINAAKALKINKDLGTLEAGKLADIVAVNGDPIADITVLQEKKNIQMVMKEGKVYADRRPGGPSKNVVNAQPGSWKIIDYL